MPSGAPAPSGSPVSAGVVAGYVLGPLAAVAVAGALWYGGRRRGWCGAGSANGKSRTASYNYYGYASMPLPGVAPHGPSSAAYAGRDDITAVLPAAPQPGLSSFDMS